MITLWEMVVHLAVASDVLVVSFCAALIQQDVLDEIWDWIEPVAEEFPTYF